MKRIVGKARKKQAFMAAGVVVGVTLTACGVDVVVEETQSVVNNEEIQSFADEVEDGRLQQEFIEDSVITESQMAAAKEELYQNQEEERKQLTKWLPGKLTGTWGDNCYTDTLLEQTKNNGVTDYLTFATEGKNFSDAAIVIAGKKIPEGIQGSIWYVISQERVELLEQNVTFQGETIASIENARDYAVFLNFNKAGVEEGRIIGFGDTSSWELLEGVAGVKNVLDDATIEVIAPVETTDGIATVRYQYALEDKVFTKLETTVLEGGEYLAAVDLEKLPWAQEAFHASTISRESWDNPSIVGEQFVPAGAEAEILSGLLPDFSKAWERWSDDYWSKWDSENRYYQMFQIQETDSFSVYGTHIDSRMIIETYDGSFVQIEGYFTSNYGVQPQALERDWDNDGCLELAMITLTKHGTGVYINDLWIVDQASDDKWYVYEQQFDWYERLNDLFAYQDTEQGLALLVKDEVVAVYADVLPDVSEKYGVGNHIYYEFIEDKLLLRTLFEVYTEDMLMPIYSDGYLVGELAYQGDGKWSILDYAYENDICE